ncbi:hypothetical protein PIB30_044423 [Stylosanthes scabra]|uniref:Phytosulfokine n=1 Tax=Stylosanthes scabra TaxID=79078 RepID=A0ABU6ZEN6_9FABA|nr:hypothetical protein [Stylosanthes scabra]
MIKKEENRRLCASSSTSITQKKHKRVVKLVTKAEFSSIIMSKLVTIFTLSLLLCFGLIYASRTHVQFDSMMISSSSPHEDVEANKGGDLMMEDESCEGEECLMRRTLAAHVDYIYTQKHKPRN